MELHDQIRLAREGKNMSHADLAHAMQVSVTAVKNWEKSPEDGGSYPRKPLLTKLSGLLGTRLSLLGDDPAAQLPTILESLSPETIELARKFEATPKVIRHAILTLVDAATCYKSPTGAEVTYGTLEPAPSPKRRVTLVNQPKNRNDEHAQDGDTTPK